MEHPGILLFAIFIMVEFSLETAVAGKNRNTTRMCIKDDYFICEGDLDLAGLRPHSIGFHGLVKKELVPVCIINLQNGYKDPMKTCYGFLKSNDTILHFVLNKTIAENAVHSELVANFLYVNGEPGERKKVKWTVEDPKVLRYDVQVNDVILKEGQQCNVAITKEKPNLKVIYQCDTDTIHKECRLIINDTNKQVGIVSQQNVPIDLDVPILLKGSTFTFGLQVCQHQHFITECTVTVAEEVPIENVVWYLLFIITVSIMCASVGMNFFFWYIYMRYRKGKKMAKENYPASLNPLMTPLSEKGDIV